MGETIKSICARGQVVRSSYYSTTYRGRLEIKGQEGEWDVQHITIPFPLRRELELKARFGLEDRDLEAFYAAFAHNLKRDLRLRRDLGTAGNSRLGEVLTTFAALQTSREEDGTQHIFVVGKPREALIGSEGFTETEAKRSAVLELGLRLLQHLKKCSEAGISLGAIDPESVVLEEVCGRPYVKLEQTPLVTADSLAAPMIGADNRTFLRPDVASGEALPSFDGDVYALCALLKTIFCGNHYTQAVRPGQQMLFCSAETAAAIEKGLQEGASAVKTLDTALRAELKAVREGECQDITIRFAPPDHAAAFVSIDNHFRNEAARQKAAKRREEGRKKSGRKKAKKPAAVRRSRFRRTVLLVLVMLVLLTAALLARCGGIFGPGRGGASSEASGERQESTEGTTEARTETAEESRDCPTSRSTGLYRHLDEVVDGQGRTVGSYFISEDGAIAYAASRLPISPEELVFTNAVRDLTEVKEVTVSAGDGCLTLPKNLADRYNIKVGDVLLLADEVLQAEGAASASGKYPKVLELESDPRTYRTRIRFAEADWSEVYRLVDDELYAKLMMVGREKELVIRERVSQNGGEQTVLYYDDDGVLYTEADWLAQEKEREAIRQVKAELEQNRASQGVTVIVPAEGVEDFVYIEEIRLAKQIYTITLNKEKETMFIVAAAVFPANATNRRVTVMLEGDGGASFPYAYNGPYILEEADDGAELTRMTADYARVADGRMTFVVKGEALGTETLTVKAEAGYAWAGADIVLTDESGHTEDIPETIDVPETVAPEEPETQPAPETEPQSRPETRSASETEPQTKPEPAQPTEPGTSGTSETAHQHSLAARTVSEASCSAPGRTETYCTDCGEVLSFAELPQLAHTEASRVTKAATANADGTYEIYCSVCGKLLRSGVIPRTGPAETEPQTTKAAEPTAPTDPWEEAFTVTPTSVVLHVGEKIKLSPSDSCIWSSSNTSVATIGGEQGRTVTAKRVGKCTIKAQAAGSDEVVYISVEVIE